MSHSDSHCLREQFFGPQLKAAHSVILFCSCLIPPAITQTVVHRGLSSDSNSSWFYLAPPIAASPQRCPSLIPLVERDFQVPGMLDEVGSCVYVSMCVCLWWGLAPSGSPATPFPGPSHGRQPSSPSEDPPHSPPISPTAPLLVAMLSSHSPLSRPWLIWVLIRERKTDYKLHASKDLPALSCNDQVYQ